MPWTEGDVETFNKGLTSKQKAQWVAVANSALATCLKDGRKDCEASAIKQANGVVAESMHEHASLGEKLLEAVFEFDESATVRQTVQGFLRAARAVAGHPKMPEEVKAKVETFRQQLLSTWAGIIADDEGEITGGTPEPVGASEAIGGGLQSIALREVALRSGQSVQELIVGIEKQLREKYAVPPGTWAYVSDLYEDRFVYTIGPDQRYYEATYTLGADGRVLMGAPTEVERTTVYRPVLRESLREATKTEGGKSFPVSDYAYVPDPEKPSEWKLRLTATPGGTPDSGIVGAAIAALGAGFRGQKVDIPAADLAGVKAKVRAAWKKANPDKDVTDMPPVIREAFAEEGSIVEAATFEEDGALVEYPDGGKHE